MDLPVPFSPTMMVIGVVNSSSNSLAAKQRQVPGVFFPVGHALGIEQDALEIRRLEPRQLLAVGHGHVRQRNRAVFRDRKGRIVRHFPDMAVGIGEIAVPAAPEGAAGRLDDAAAGLFGLRQHLVDLGVGAGVVGEIDGGRRLGEGDARILLGALARKQAENRAAHLEEGDAVGDAGVAGQAHRLVEAHGAVEIVGGDGDDGDARFHPTPPSIPACACR